jgi:lipopolysaccharide/colanic/teichoic acid biosynthesis glycosyltransferase
MTDTVRVMVEASSSGASGLSAWNYSPFKRLFDVVLTGVLLAFVSPVLAIIAILIKLDSAGPVFFRQQRAGKDGRLFRLIKFRTMVHHGNDGGPKVTRAGDKRVTSLGQVLRKWKLDELPQLFNVILGDMAFVGPRPDVPEYLAELTSAQAQILHLRPGITGMASIRYRNEEQLLLAVQEGELPRYYCTHILPDKVRIDLEYARRASFLSDLGVLFQTLRVLVH